MNPMIPIEQCLQLQLAGFPQKHSQYSRYYLGKEFYIDFEISNRVYATNETKDDGRFESLNPTRDLVFIPRLEDLIGELPQLYRLTHTDHGWEAWGTFKTRPMVEEDEGFDPAVPKTIETAERYVAEGVAAEDCLANLYLLYHEIPKVEIPDETKTV